MRHRQLEIAAHIVEGMAPVQGRLDFRPPVGRQFFGAGYEPKLDQKRWEGHCAAVLGVLQRGPSWWTYEDLARAARVPIGSVRTRVSNLKADGQPIETRTRADRFREVRLA